MCDRCAHVLQGAAAPAVPGGQRGDRQSLLDESCNVLHCLGNEGAVSVFLSVRLVSFPFLLPVPHLVHFQLPAGCGFRRGRLPFDEIGFSHRRVERAGPPTSHRLVRGYFRFFGLTGSCVVMVAAPHGFGRVVRCKQAGREWWGCWVTEVEPLCNSSNNFLSLLQQRANQRVPLVCGRPWGGATGRLCHGEILQNSQGLGDGTLRLFGVAGTELIHLRGVGRTIEGRIQPLSCFACWKRGRGVRAGRRGGVS